MALHYRPNSLLRVRTTSCQLILMLPPYGILISCHFSSVLPDLNDPGISLSTHLGSVLSSNLEQNKFEV